MKKLIGILIIAFSFMKGISQTVFIQKGKIEFERKTNTHRLYLNEEAGSWTEEFKKLVPQFKTDYFDLVFTETSSVYKPGKEVEEKKTGFFESPATENVVYKDFNQHTVVTQKQIFESQFLISDSIRKLKWKLEPETRTIAGFECRKAVTRICDSVVVVAFYTDEIAVPGGPESFGGLPGMILGLAIPRLYTTWFATKLETVTDNEEKKIMPPAKGKKANQTDMIGKVNDGIKSWGEKYRSKAIWFVTL